MQATMSPVSFNGSLGNAIEDKKSALKHKKDALTAERNLTDQFGQLTTDKFEAAEALFKSASDKTTEGKNQNNLMMSDAKDARMEGLKQTTKDGVEDIKNALTTLRESRAQARDFAAKIEELAYEADKLRYAAEADLKVVSKDNKQLSKALEAMTKGEMQELDDVSETVAKSQQARSKAVQAAEEAIATVSQLKTDTETLISEKLEEAAEKRGEAKGAKSGGYAAARKSLIADLVKAKEDSATSLSNVRDAYRVAVKEAKALLQEYQDLAGADREKGNALKEELGKMEQTVNKLNRQAFYTRATNLLTLATETLGLGEAGKGATEKVVNRIIRTLKSSDWFTGVAGKVTAVDAARLFIKEGDSDQKTLVGSKVNLNAMTMVQKTNSLEVLEGMEQLDKDIDSLQVEG